jgi:hypothetical protein
VGLSHRRPGDTSASSPTEHPVTGCRFGQQPLQTRSAGRPAAARPDRSLFMLGKCSRSHASGFSGEHSWANAIGRPELSAAIPWSSLRSSGAAFAADSLRGEAQPGAGAVGVLDRRRSARELRDGSRGKRSPARCVVLNPASPTASGEGAGWSLLPAATQRREIRHGLQRPTEI